MNYFLVTSAVNSRFGVYQPDVRLNQTLDTIRSIREREPNGKIYVLEMCGTPLTDEQRNQFKDACHLLVEFSGDPDVQEIYKVESQDIVKNLTEVTCCHKFFNFALTEDGSKLFSEPGRVFKVSGRYKLNHFFLPDEYNHEIYQDKIVVGMNQPSQFELTLTGVPRQYMSRLWSFPSTRINFIADYYKQMGEYMLSRLNQGKYVDIEHCLYKFLPNPLLVEKMPLGLTGALAPNGVQIED